MTDFLVRQLPKIPAYKRIPQRPFDEYEYEYRQRLSASTRKTQGINRYPHPELWVMTRLASEVHSYSTRKDREHEYRSKLRSGRGVQAVLLVAWEAETNDFQLAYRGSFSGMVMAGLLRGLIGLLNKAMPA